MNAKSEMVVVNILVQISMAAFSVLAGKALF